MSEIRDFLPPFLTDSTLRTHHTTTILQELNAYLYQRFIDLEHNRMLRRWFKEWQGMIIPFGSILHGTAINQSDIDILNVCNPEKTLESYEVLEQISFHLFGKNVYSLPNSSRLYDSFTIHPHDLSATALLKDTHQSLMGILPILLVQEDMIFPNDPLLYPTTLKNLRYHRKLVLKALKSAWDSDTAQYETQVQPLLDKKLKTVFTRLRWKHPEHWTTVSNELFQQRSFERIAQGKRPLEKAMKKPARAGDLLEAVRKVPDRFPYPQELMDIYKLCE